VASGSCYCIEILEVQIFWVGDMSFCFVRQAISRQPWPNRAKVSLLPNWSLATHIVKISKRVWFFVASQSICLISSFPMIQNLGHFTQNMELHNSSGQVPDYVQYCLRMKAKPNHTVECKKNAPSQI